MPPIYTKRRPRVLVACEFSGTVRDAFAKAGYDAWSCDRFRESETFGNHLRCDVREVLDQGWDLMVAHPPCTYLAVSGAAWFSDPKRIPRQQRALEFVRLLLAAPIPRIALENPVSIISSRIRKPDQILHPWQHGHNESKTICLWLKGLPLLAPTKVVAGRTNKKFRMRPGPERRKDRSRFFKGVALAMVQQWGPLL